MAKCHLTYGPDGVLCLSWVIPGPGHLEKAIFELSRTTDMSTHFKAATHTLEAIAKGIPGHRPLAIVGVCDGSEVPQDMYFRDAWQWVD